MRDLDCSRKDSKPPPAAMASPKKRGRHDLFLTGGTGAQSLSMVCVR